MDNDERQQELEAIAQTVREDSLGIKGLQAALAGYILVWGANIAGNHLPMMLQVAFGVAAIGAGTLNLLEEHGHGRALTKEYPPSINLQTLHTQWEKDSHSDDVKHIMQGLCILMGNPHYANTLCLERDITDYPPQFYLDMLKISLKFMKQTKLVDDPTAVYLFCAGLKKNFKAINTALIIPFNDTIPPKNAMIDETIKVRIALICAMLSNPSFRECALREAKGYADIEAGNLNFWEKFAQGFGEYWRDNAGYQYNFLSSKEATSRFLGEVGYMHFIEQDRFNAPTIAAQYFAKIMANPGKY
jgi:hypothetical protein